MSKKKKNENEEAVNQIIVFEPTDKPYKEEYPELRTIPEFNVVEGRILKWIWGYAAPCSPYAHMSESSRIKRSFKYLDKNKDRSLMKKFKYKRFNDKEKAAIKRMQQINPDIRSEMFAKVQRIKKNYDLLIELSDQEKKAMDMMDRKRYIDLTSAYMDKMPSLVNIFETGFGTRAASESTGSTTSKKKKSGSEETPKKEVSIESILEDE